MDGIDPRVQLATMLIGMTVEAGKRILDLIHQNKDDDQVLADILAKAEARLARRPD